MPGTLGELESVWRSGEERESREAAVRLRSAERHQLSWSEAVRKALPHPGTSGMEVHSGSLASKKDTLARKASSPVTRYHMRPR